MLFEYIIMTERSDEDIEQLIGRLRNLLPAAFSEGVVNLDALRRLAGNQTQPERYELNWAGKTAAYRALQDAATHTLEPQMGESIAWQEARDIFIEGENLEVLRILQKPYYGKIRAIYIDPPYNTGSDRFIYSDRFGESKQSYLKRTGQADEDGYLISDNIIRLNRKESGHFHSNWLSMMLPRLFLARNLLHQEGFIFVSIDDHELASLRLLMDEVFGEENFRNIILVRRYDKNINTQFLANGLTSFNTGAEYVLIYSKAPDARMHPVFRDASAERSTRGYWKGFWNDAERKTMQYELLGVNIDEGQWKWKEEVATEAVKNYEDYLREFSDKMPLETYWQKTGGQKKFIRRNPGGKGRNQGVEHWIPPTDKILRNTLWHDVFASKFPANAQVPFNNPKNVDLIKSLITIAFGGIKDGYVLDFFAGSGSTAQSVIEFNRDNDAHLRFITVQLPEEIDRKEKAYAAGHRFVSDITRKRISDVISYWSREDAANGISRPATGYRSFRLTPSHFNTWNPSVSDTATLTDQLTRRQNKSCKEVPAEKILWELLLQHGVAPDCEVEQITTSSGYFYFAPEERVAIVIEKYQPELLPELLGRKPKKIIYLDAAFEGDDARKAGAIRAVEQENILFESI